MLPLAPRACFIFVLYGPIIFPFLTDYEKIYLMQLFVNVETCPHIDENLRNPHLLPIIRFALLCKETYLKGNLTPIPISDGELDVIPMRNVLTDFNPTRRETISMLQDLHRLGGVKRRLSSWHDPVNRTVRRIFIMAWRKKQIQSVPKDVLCRIICHLWNKAATSRPTTTKNGFRP